MTRFTMAVLLVAFGARAQESEEFENCKEAFGVGARIRGQLAAPGHDLELIHRQLTRETQQCALLSSLWKLRAQVARQRKDGKDAALAEASANGPHVMSDREFEALMAVTPRSFNPAEPVRAHWALIAGTWKYRDPEVATLEYGESDLAAVKAVVRDRFGYRADHILEATGPGFTQAAMRERIARLRESVQEDDLVFVYVLSHSLAGAEDVNTSSVLLTFDTVTESPKSRYETGLLLTGFVQEVFRELKARRIVMVLDTCFGGDAITGQRGAAGRASPKFLEMLTQGSGRVVIGASSADQRSWELPEKKHGAFAHCFQSAVASQAQASVAEIFSATRACVTRAVQALNGQSQTPGMFASEGAGRMVLSAIK